MFLIHYSYRGIYYPLSIKVHPGAKKNFSLLPAVGGWLVTIPHGYLNAKWLAEHGKHLANKKWLNNIMFQLGFIIYYFGFLNIIYHDSIIRNLRTGAPNEPRYKIPKGGFYDYCIAGAYTVELIAWFGWAMTSGFGPNGLFIFFVSCFNLIPRSAVTNQWFVDKFGDEYTQLELKNIIPFVW